MTVRSLIWISLTSPLPTTSSTKITGQIGYNLTYPSIQPAHDPKAIQHGAGREMKGPTGGPSPAWSKEIGCYDRIAVPSAMMSASFHSMKGSERQRTGRSAAPWRSIDQYASRGGTVEKIMVMVDRRLPLSWRLSGEAGGIAIATFSP
eukprot:Gb_34006 [translate_table: standard]